MRWKTISAGAITVSIAAILVIWMSGIQNTVPPDTNANSPGTDQIQSINTVKTTAPKVVEPIDIFAPLAPDGATVRGQVLRRDDPSSGIGGATITAKSEHGLQTQVYANPDGTFAFEDLPPGRVQLDVVAVPGMHGNPLDANRLIVLDPGQEVNDIFFYVDSPVSISGLVVGRNDRPVVGALVSVWNATEQMASVYTASNGRFQFEQIAADEKIQMIARHGKQISKCFGAREAWSINQDDLILRLFDGAGIEGHITNVDGDPVPDVVVVASANSYSEYGGCWLTRSDSRGEYVLTDLPPGNFHLCVHAEAVEMGSTNSEQVPYEISKLPSSVMENTKVHEGEVARVDFVVGAFMNSHAAVAPGETGVLAGRVVNNRKEPIENAKVTITYKQIHQMTGVDGTFRFEQLSFKSLYLYTEAPGFGGMYVSFEPDNEQIEIVLDTDRKIFGFVRDRDTRKLINRFSIAVKYGRYSGIGWHTEYPIEDEIFEDESAVRYREEFHSEEGRFVVDRMPRKDVVLFVLAEGYEAGVINCTYEESADAPLDVLLSRRPGTRGRVVNMEAVPVSNAFVYADNLEAVFNMIQSGAPRDAVRTDERGEFDLGVSLPGRRVIYAWAPGYSVGEWLLKPGESTATIVLRNDAGLFVRVHRAGEPLDGASISVDAIEARNGHKSTYAIPLERPPREPGLYYASGVPEGSYAVRVFYSERPDGRRYDISREVYLQEGVDVEMDVSLDY